LIHPDNHYKNFSASIYATVYDVLKMKDLDWLRETFDLISGQIKIDKIYLETHRDLIIADEPTYRQAQDFFKSRGVRVAGGITITVNERNFFETYCYTKPEHRQKLIEVVEYTARLNDEVILDDFFFTNCKCADCIAAKGERSWTEFRLELMAQAARELVLEPARKVNPNVQVVVKYPNWYEHFQGLGFNLEIQPQLFDRVYTGTETRDAVMSNQHLQPYHGYSVFRYFENLKPGGNGGGWVDVFGISSLDRYAEQFWLTMFAKAPEVTLFNYSVIQQVIQESDRAAWQGQKTSFDFDRAFSALRGTDGALSPTALIARVAGDALEQVDQFIGQLGKPIGIPCYKPYHSSGEDFLHSYLGMIGLPVDLTPEFPSAAPVVLLTESASFDDEIVGKIKGQLQARRTVVITSGLLQKLQDRGLGDVVEMELTGRKMSTDTFLMDWRTVSHSTQPILVPHIRYFTNDSWEEISCQAGVAGTPLLHSAQYGGGRLFVLVIPDHPGDLYKLPREVLSRISRALTSGLPVRIDSPSQVALFVYDNNHVIVESFRDEAVDLDIVLDNSANPLLDVLSGERLVSQEILGFRGQPTGKKATSLTLKPHSFRLLRW
jgi:hypothetical protein